MDRRFNVAPGQLLVVVRAAGVWSHRDSSLGVLHPGDHIIVLNSFPPRSGRRRTQESDYVFAVTSQGWIGEVHGKYVEEIGS